MTLPFLPSPACSLPVTAAVIRAYAELTDDFNPLHLDEEFAASTPMGRVIAHGTLSLCLMWQWVHQNFDADVFTGLRLDVRFIKPVFVGDLLTAGGQPRAGTRHCWDVWVRVQDGTDRIAGELRMNPPKGQEPGERQ